VHNGGMGIFTSNNGATVADSFVSENGSYGIFVVNQSLRLTNTFLSGNDVLVFSPYCCPPDFAYVANDVFRNSSVFAQDAAVVIDGSGNKCAIGIGPNFPCVLH
jgi:hypothetical protein